MNKNHTLKELADIGAKAGHSWERDWSISPNEAFTKAILDAIGYEFPKDEEREAFERWYDHVSKLDLDANLFEAWKAGREELRRSQMDAKELVETKTEPAWIPWEGGECPLADTVKRWEYRTRGGQCILTPNMPRSYRWWFSDDKDFNLDDILAYRVWEG